MLVVLLLLSKQSSVIEASVSPLAAFPMPFFPSNPSQVEGDCYRNEI